MSRQHAADTAPPGAHRTSGAAGTTRTTEASRATGVQEADALSIGRRIRHFRTQAGLTLGQLGEKVGRAPSQISVMENGKREPGLGQLRALAEALGVTADDLLDPEPVDARQALELEVERNQRSPLYTSLHLPRVRAKSLPQDALAAIAGLQRQLADAMRRRAATPEEARRVNRNLRERMRRQGNHFPELEKVAGEVLARIGYTGGPLSQRQTAAVADDLGYSLHYVSDLPASTRAVADTAHRRLYLSHEDVTGHDPRSHVLTALASHILGHETPADYEEFLTQRVEANYLAAALLMPESAAVPMLQAAKKNRSISIEELRDLFGVSYETSAHRFTNLATAHLGLPVHFMKVHSSGTIHKAYSNDGLPFPTDPMGAVEGQFACKRFTSRTVHRVADRFSPYFQYTDTPNGTYWCTARVLPGGEFSISVGVPFAHVGWFEGRETAKRSRSECPDPDCCRRPPAELAERWEDSSWPSARTHASLLAAVPPGVFPGVDTTEVYAFLDRHAPE
ncbi:helix-turn-helix domain-containing protein [Brevibacterium salitolerans]|jgi:predicted transcriptional regulator/transcriptional regulator with XRE-family HTH domain|uniref:HTH cro/C1-type domain-containing protein n=1 Tax=Brevibacterium salitolerans TaxID=1403566 RepID=A0ABN2WSQ5_9MICO